MRKEVAVQPAQQDPASCLVRRLEGVAGLLSLEGDHMEADVIYEAVAVLKTNAPPAQRQPLTPAYIREGIAAHIEDVFSLEKVWTVREAADYIRSIEIHGTKEKNT